jgi:methionyl-tRNA formyltransferase
MGAEAIVEALAALQARTDGASAHIELRFEPQPETGVTSAHKVQKAEARIDWRLDAAAVSCHIRAFDPHPGASSALARLPDEPIRFFAPVLLPLGEAGAAGAAPGQVLSVDSRGIVVATGSGCLLIGQLQRAGGRRLAVAEFLRGHRIEPGERLVCP